MKRAAAPTSNASLLEIVSRSQVKREPRAEVIVFSRRTTRSTCLSFISYEDVHDGLAAAWAITPAELLVAGRACADEAVAETTQHAAGDGVRPRLLAA